MEVPVHDEPAFDRIRSGHRSDGLELIAIRICADGVLEFLDPFRFKRLQSFSGRVDGHGPDVDNNAEGPRVSRVNVEILSREVSAVISSAS